MADVRRRLERLEQRTPDREPYIIWYLSGDHPPPSEEEKRNLLTERLQRNPGQPMYTLIWPPQERRQDAS